MNDFYTSTAGGSLWSPSCPDCEERKGSRKGAFDQAMFDWMYDNEMLSEKYEFEETLQDIKDISNKYHMSFYDAATVYMAALDNQTSEDDAIKRNLKPMMPLTQPPRQGSRKGSRKGLRYDWDGVPFEEIEFRLDSPVIDEDIYSMSDEELLQFAEDHGLRPEMFTNELPDWAQRDGRKGSRKGSKYDWYGIPLEKVEERLYEYPIKRDDLYEMSDEELIQCAEDHGLKPDMFPFQG